MIQSQKPTPDGLSEEFACDLCGDKFDSISELAEHKQQHMHPTVTEDENDRDLRRDIGAPGLPTSPVF